MSRDRLDLSRLPLTGNLPSLPTVALEVLRIVQDPDADVDALASTLSLDPPLAGRVLQMANSPVYNRGTEVTSLQRAAMMLGLRSLKVVALGFTLTGDLPRDGSSGGLDLKAYWHRSALAAVAGRTLASMLDRASVEEAFLAGLLSQLGKLALAQGLPEEYGAICRDAHWPTEAEERAALGYSSSHVAEAMLADWGVPELIVAGAAFPERLDELPSTTTHAARTLAELTSVALSAAAVFCSAEPATHLPALIGQAEERFSLGEEDISALVAALQAGMRETADLLALELPSGISYQGILDQARMQIVAVSLDTAMSLQQTEQRVDELAARAEEAESRAHTDALTGLPNRAALEDFLARQINVRQRGSMADALGVLMIDVDRFKQFNDTYGHQAGDEVLCTVAATMAEITRTSDLLARYGGEEFCLIMTQTTPAGLRIAAERLREAIEKREVDLGGQGIVNVTASFGGACLEDVSGPDDATRVLEVADQWLYRAKHAGRNRVEVCPRRVAAAA